MFKNFKLEFCKC